MDKPKIIDSGYQYEVQLNYDSIQRIARHPEYRRLCDQIIFDKHGFAEIDFTVFDKNEHKNAVESIREKFGINTPIKPDRIISGEISAETIAALPDISPRGPFAVELYYLSRSENGGMLESHPTSANNKILLRICRQARLKNQVVSGIKEYLHFSRGFADKSIRTGTPVQLIDKDRNAITILIDVLSDEGVIISNVSKYIKNQPGRFHPKRLDYYRIWDKKAYEVKSFQKIAEEINRTKSGPKVTADLIRKRFAIAHGLIFGEDNRYDYVKKRERTALLERRFSDLPASLDDGQYADPINQEEASGVGYSDSIAYVELYHDIQKICGKCPNIACYESVIDGKLGLAEKFEIKPCAKLIKYLTP